MYCVYCGHFFLFVISGRLHTRTRLWRRCLVFWNPATTATVRRRRWTAATSATASPELPPTAVAAAAAAAAAV